MHRLARYDVDRWKGDRHGVSINLSFGIACAAIGITARSLLDIWAPNAAPFALVYPTVLIATLYGRASAGLAAYLISFIWAWWYVLPVERSFRFETSVDTAQFAVNAVCVLIVLALAEAFRRAFRMATEARDLEIERRGVLMTEMEHRTKNNFALVASLLSLQAKNQDDPAVSAALNQAINRIRTFAQAYDSLAMTEVEGKMPMQHYIHDVVAKVGAAVIPEQVSVEVEAGECLLPQQVAVAIGLFLNEALTNCAKYAFPVGRTGNIRVRFSGSDEGWEISVVDDGVGNAAHGRTVSTGLGQNLMKAFAQQANARYEHRITPEGCRVALSSDLACQAPEPSLPARELSPA